MPINDTIDYYPFGMQMPDRVMALGSYKYGFNSQEKTDEIAGSGNSYTAEFWQYDSRLGRRWNVDPITVESESPYTCFSNNPSLYSDPYGDFKTKFRAKVFRFFHGSGEVLQDIGGEWFVGDQIEYKEEGEGATYQKRFDWHGRSKGEDLVFEARKNAWLNNYKFSQDLDAMGIDYSYTNDINEARRDILNLSLLVVIPNPILKQGTALINASRATSTVKSNIKWVYGSFKSDSKWASQLVNRGWTPEQITEAIAEGKSFKP